MDWVTDRASNKVRGIASHKVFLDLHVLGICVVLGVEGGGGETLLDLGKWATSEKGIIVGCRLKWDPFTLSNNFSTVH